MDQGLWRSLTHTYLYSRRGTQDNRLSNWATLTEMNCQCTQTRRMNREPCTTGKHMCTAAEGGILGPQGAVAAAQSTP